MTRNAGFGGTLKQLTVLLVAATLVVSAGAAGVALGATSTAVSVQSDQTIEAGQAATFDVVVDSTDNDVGAAEGIVELTNPDVAEITDVTYAGTTNSVDVTIADDGSSADFTGFYGDNSLAGSGQSVTVLTVTVEGTAAGQTGVELSEFLVFDDGGQGYDVTGTTPATLTVEESSTGGSSGDAVFAVNAGGSQYTAADGTVYQADTNFDGGETFTSGDAGGTPSEPDIANTENDQLYWTERYGDFGYDISVPESGQYEVTLYFAELYQGVANDGGEGDRVFDVSAEGQTVLDGYDIIAQAGAPQTAVSETTTVEVTDGTLNLDFTTIEDNAKVSAIEVTKVDDGGDPAPGTTGASVTVNEGSSNLDASTFGSGSFEVTNTGETTIDSVTIDLSESIIPDAVFDPQGTAGDSGAKEFTPNSGGSETGLVDGTLEQPHNGENGDDGYDALTITFADGEFQPGETLTFAVDIDPTAIKGVSGTGDAGSVSGLELSGSAVTVQSPSATVTNDLFTDGSQGGSQVAVGAGSTDAPTLGVEGVSLSGTDFPAHEAATVADQQQTLTISGPAGESVTLLHLVGTPAPADGYDIEAFEADSAASVSSQTVQLDSDGTATVDVSLSEANLDYFMTAVDVGEDTSRTSDTVILDYDADAGDNTAPTIDAIGDQTVTEGDSATVPVNANDADGDSVSLSVTGPDFVTLSNGELTIAPASGDAGVYTIEVTADDGTTTTTESFQLTVEEASTGGGDGSGEVVFAVNAGGSQYTAADGTVYQADTNFDGGNTYSVSGTPEIENTENDPLYRTERYGAPFGYDIPVSESGTYEVTLKFAEIYQGVSPNDNTGDQTGDRVFSASIEGQEVLTEYDLWADVGSLTATEKTYTVEVTDGTLNVDFSASADNAKVSAIEVTKVGDGGDEPAPDVTSAQVDITPNSGVDASTYNGGSFEVTNTGDTNVQTITLDTSETMLPDMVFDPFNTAGDDVGKEFTLDGGDVTVQNVEYTNFHNGQDNSAGYDTMVVTVSGFEPGETMSFSVDMDPTSISSTGLGSQAAGPVSGLETVGMTVSVDSGSGPVEATVIGDGSAGGATATVAPDESDSAPTIGVQDVSLTDVGLSDRHSAATVGEAQQTITITGAPANTEVTLLRAEGELNLNNVPDPYEIEAYEANKLVNVEYYTVTTDANGEATVQVELTDANAVEESGLNYFTAWTEESDGDTGPVSNYVVLELGEPNDDTDAPPAVGSFDDAPTDPDGDGVYEDVNGDGEFTVSDVQAFFQNYEGQVIQNNPDAFDFNSAEGVTISDVQKLFVSSQEAAS